MSKLRLPMWKIVKAEDHWLTLDDPEGWYTADVRWDGCIHFNRYYNTPLVRDKDRDDDSGMDYIHICDLDEYIERLELLRSIAKKHYKDHHYYKQSWGKNDK